MKEIKTRESIGKDNAIGPSLAYKMRKGLLKEKKTAGQYNAESETSESEVTGAEETADTAVNQTAGVTERSASYARKAHTRSREKQRNRIVGIEKESQIAKADIITSVNSPRAGAADTAAPSFGVSKGTGAKQSVVVRKRDRAIKNRHYMSGIVTNSDGVSSATAHSASPSPAKRSFISKRAEEISRKKFSKTAEKSSTAIGRAFTGAAKAVKEGVSNLAMLLAAGGSVPMIVIILICSIGLAVGSVFGIFFASEDTGSNKTMQTVVQEINKEYRDEVDRIKADNPHDLVKLEGSSSVWRDVLSVYAVIVNTDPNNPQEVATLNAAKIDTLRDLFWKMNSITSSIETVTETVETEIADENGNFTETVTEEKEMTLLHIIIRHRTAYEMAGEYDFDTDQMLSLMELLDKKNDSMWAAVLYGIHSGDTAIIEVAASQIGNEGGEPYWSWYGFSSRVEWCACFVSWCANECGYIEDGIIPKNANCNGAVKWFKDHDQWAEGSAEPIPGMIIYFDWDNKGSAEDQNGTADHVGIVEKVEDGWVYPIEGNSRDSVRRNKYRIGHYEILGYGIPEY